MSQATTFDRFLHGGKIAAGFAMGGSVLAGTSLGWVPAFASVDVHAVGGAIGLMVGLVLSVRHIV